MSGILKFKVRYSVLALIIFFIEILIALFVNDRIIRPYLGDFLVVILIYCFLRSFIDLSVISLALSALIFSFMVETCQYFNILSRLGLQDSKFAKTVMGSSFEWTDLVAYTSGIALVLYLERLQANKAYKKSTMKASWHNKG